MFNNAKLCWSDEDMKETFCWIKWGGPWGWGKVQWQGCWSKTRRPIWAILTSFERYEGGLPVVKLSRDEHRWILKYCLINIELSSNHWNFHISTTARQNWAIEHSMWCYDDGEQTVKFLEQCAQKWLRSNDHNSGGSRSGVANWHAKWRKWEWTGRSSVRLRMTRDVYRMCWIRVECTEMHKVGRKRGGKQLKLEERHHNQLKISMWWAPLWYVCGSLRGAVH